MKKVQSGALGEKLVAKYYRDQGFQVDESLDLYDRKKDMSIGELTCEVKTQQMFHVERAFSVNANQIAKCNAVDLLIFVETPSSNNGNKVNIWKYLPENRITRIRKTKDGRTMHLYDVSSCELLTCITDEYIINQFKEYSNSEWRR